MIKVELTVREIWIIQHWLKEQLAINPKLNELKTIQTKLLESTEINKCKCPKCEEIKNEN